MSRDHDSTRKNVLTTITNRYRLIAAFGLVAVVLLIFQNCSDIAFAPAYYPDEPGVGFNANPTHSYASMTVGSSAIPDLKMVFIVDNSYTMTANQVNLSQSFANMFSQQNSTNLTLFNTTTYLINTAQLSLPLNSTKLPQLSALQFSKDELMTMTSSGAFSPSDFLAEHRPNSPTEITGAIPGDSIGYNVKRLSADKMDFIFEPMPVMGLLQDNNGFYFDGGVHKPANVAADAMITDFQNRLSLLNSLRSSDNYPEVTDNESAMCAFARILNRHEHYFKSGDVPAFVIVSDENEANVSGDRCVASYSNFTGEEDLVKGDCEERTTTIAGTYNEITPAKCNLAYKSGYNVNYAYTTPTTNVDYYVRTTESPRTKIEYYKSAGYETPRTKISYFATSKKYKRSSVAYYLTVCEVRDGVVVEGSCSNVKQPAALIDGDVTLTAQSCIDAAKSINAKALYGGAYLASEQPVCTAAEPRPLIAGQNCELSDPNCIFEYVPKSEVVFGTYTTVDSCKTRAAQISGAYIATNDNSHVPTCVPDSSIIAASGVCPSSHTGCVQRVTFINGDQAAIVDGDYTNNFTNCQNKAKTFTSAYVTAAYPATCLPYDNKVTPCNPSDATQLVCPRTISLDGEVTTNCHDFATAKKSSMAGIILGDSNYAPRCTAGTPKPNAITKSITFSADIINPLVDINAPCTDAIKSKLLSNNPTLPPGGTCTIKSYQTGGQLVAKDNLLTCEQIKLNYESTNAGKVSQVTATLVPEASSTKNFLKIEKQEIDCNSQCSSTNFCTASVVGGVSYVTNSTISDYLKSVYGPTFSCSVGGIVRSKVGTFSDVEVSQMSSKACVPSATGVKRYAVQDGAIYHKVGVRTSFVSGNGEGDNLPEKDLRQYIQDKSNEIFGVGNAMVTTFVRQTQDGTGQGGSVGVDYEQLASNMGGQKFSVMLNDYSPALVQLSQIIKAKLDRTFVVPGLNPPLKIYTVWMKSGSASWFTVDQALWTQSGATLTLDSTVEVNLGDRIKVEFY